MIDNIIILSLIILAFVSGMKISDKYHDEAERHEEYALRLQNARIQAQDYNVYLSPQPRQSQRQPIGTRFEERLRKNGRATQLVNKDNPIS